VPAGAGFVFREIYLSYSSRKYSGKLLGTFESARG